MINNTTYSSENLNIYFQSQRAGFDAQIVAQLVTFIEATQQSLDCAIYDLRHPDILNALAHVVHDGKRLRIAFDAGKQRSGGTMADPKPGGTQRALEEAGLTDNATPIHEGRYLMHDKFLVRDGRSVWTGSANFTIGGLELQDNNCLVIESSELAENYTAVFEELVSAHHRSSHTGTAWMQPPPTKVVLGDVNIAAFFSPAMGEAIEQAVVDMLNQAKRVRVMAFLISDPGILDAVASFADDPNIDIKGVYDPNGMNDVLRSTHQAPSLFWFTDDPRFVAAPSHAFDPQREQDFMHNKVLIIDDHLVVSGSYNFSENAESNDENLLVIDSPEVAAAYTAYFDALYTIKGRTSG